MTSFIFMLTKNDVTIANAREVFSQVADLAIPYVGFKDIGLPFDDLRHLAQDIRSNGQKAMLEVVSQTKEDELRSVSAGMEIGVDYVLGGSHAAEAVEMLSDSGIRYMPFPGRVVGHPSRLCGPPADIVKSAVDLASMAGVAGLDLLAYRFAGDVESLVASVVAAVDKPVIVAGSIDSTERIRTVADLGVWGFTVGSAVFDNNFESGEKNLRGQIRAILDAAK